ncbi:MAG: dehydrogenase, partial [Bacteroidota bacterium]
EAAGITNVKSLVAHPGLALTNLQVTTAADGGMDGDSDFMNRAQTAEDGATGIIRAAMDPAANSGDFYGPTAGWKGFPDLLEPEDLLLDETNLQINWDGCEKAVGAFEV